MPPRNPSILRLLVIIWISIINYNYIPAKENNIDLNATISISPEIIIAKTNNNRLLGGNIALWYKPNELAQLSKSFHFQQWNPGILRIPGGSWSDEFIWNGHGIKSGKDIDLSKLDDGEWSIDYSSYAPGFRVQAGGKPHHFHGNSDIKALHEFTKANAKETIATINMGSGSPKMAAEWVRWANILNNYNVRYWELGNELDGHWELGHTLSDGSTMTANLYAKRYIEFANEMKKIDPSIRIGGPTNSNDSILFVEELLKQAGEHVDFVSFHTYPVQSKNASSEERFHASTRVAQATTNIKEWIATYQPNRTEDIEIGVTEWHVQVHEDENTCNLQSGLWSLQFIGEMFKVGVDFANQWDTLSTTENGGHGILDPEQTNLPRAIYWSLYLWSNELGNTLIKSEIHNNRNLVSYATMDSSTPAILVINTDKDKAHHLNISNLWDGYHTASRTSFDASNYHWDKHKKRPAWSVPPSKSNLSSQTDQTITLPPLSAHILRLGETVSQLRKNSSSNKPIITISAPEKLPIERTTRIEFYLTNSITREPIKHIQSQFKLSVSNNITVESIHHHPSTAVIIVELSATSLGQGTLNVFYNGTTQTFSLETYKRPVIKQTLWDYSTEEQSTDTNGHFPVKINTEAKRNESVLQVSLDGKPISKGHDFLIHAKNQTKLLESKNISGVHFQIKISEDLQKNSKNGSIEIILQSPTKPWIPVGSIPLKDLTTEWTEQTIKLQNKDIIKSVKDSYGIILKLKPSTTYSGTLYLDNIGFLIQ